MERLAVRGADASALLSAVLERVETEIGEIGRLGMSVDPEDTAFLVDVVE
jgi:hypothetical protein